MRGPLAASLVVVAAVMIAGAYAMGMFDASRPPETTMATAATAPADAPAASDDAAPVSTASPKAVVRPPAPEIRTPLPVATTATLRIDSDVPGADVFIDNSFVGKVPAVVENVQPGRRKIHVSAPGFETVSEFRDVEPGPDELTISLRTIRLDRRVDVTHRHRLGSCEGTLIATPRGVRYETARAEDAFSAPLARIERLEADYVQRSLTIGVAGGRTFNFRAPEGNADDLYSFYQDVGKARQRVIDGGARDE